MKAPQLLLNRTLDKIPSLPEFHMVGTQWIENEFELRGTIPPLWILRSGVSLIFIATPWQDAREKDIYTETIKGLMVATLCDAYCVASESWVTAVHSEEELAEADAIDTLERLPANRRDSMLLQMTHGRKSTDFIGTAWLINEARGNLRQTLGVRQDEYFRGLGGIGGRFSNLFREIADEARAAQTAQAKGTY